MFPYRDVDDVHDMMDDISEQNEIAEEISNALSTPIGFNQEIDDVRCVCVWGCRSVLPCGNAQQKDVQPLLEPMAYSKMGGWGEEGVPIHTPMIKFSNR